MDKDGLILVMADPNLENHNVVKKAARECKVNHVFTSVFNGSQLMDLLFKKGVYYTAKNVLPDVILLDINLPDVSGFELLQKVRQDGKLKEIPVYLLSNERHEKHRVKAQEAGAWGCLTKPLSFTDVRDIIDSICKFHSDHH
jgi:CheY-like chemotaxis protein